MRRKITILKCMLTILLAAVMICPVCLQASASQAPDDDQTFVVGGVAVTAENQDDIFGDGKAAYSPDTKTLTFDDLKLVGGEAFIVCNGQDLTLDGKAAFDCTADLTSAISVKGGSLTVKGDITAKSKQGDAVVLDGGSLTVDGSLTVVSRMNLLDDDARPVTGNGVFVTGDILVNGKMNAEGTECGLKADGNIQIKGDVNAAGRRDGIVAAGEIVAAKGTIKASGRNRGLWGSVIRIEKGIDSVTATGDWAVNGSKGINLDPEIKITYPEGGTLSEDGTNIIGPEGFYATRVELTVSGEEPPETETESETETEAPETETEAPETETEAPETETEAPETETEAPETETEAPETETKAPETETKAPETETKAPETETKAPETETKAPETETKAPETETKAPETETKAPETETQAPPAVKCDISIQCVSGNAVVPGGSFELIKDKKAVDQWKGTGKVHVVKGLAEGEYILRQTAAPNGCLLAGDQKITVGKDGKTSYSGRTKNGIFLMENALTRIRIKSTDEQGNPVPGAVLQIVSGKYVASEWKADQAAKEVVGLNIDTTYTLKETAAPKWCAKAADVTFKIAGDGKVTSSAAMDKDGILLVTHKKTVVYYTVFFETGGGNTVKPQQVEEGKTALKPADPTRKDYSFSGWYTDPGLKNAFDFKTPVTADMTLYAKWAGGSGNGEGGKESAESAQPSVSYDITSGAGAVFKKGSEDEVDIVIRRSGDNASSLDHLESVMIDETLLKIETEYAVKKDQSSIALQPAALNQFEPGMRTLTVKFDDGQAQAQIHIRAQADGSGNGGDDAGTGIKGIGKMIGGAIVLVIIAAAAAVGIYIKGGKMKR